MKVINTLLIMSTLAAAGATNATLISLDATLNSQSGRTLTGTTTFSGYIDIDMGTGMLYGLGLSSDGDYTSFSIAVVMTYYQGSEWHIDNSGLYVDSLVSDGGTGFIATYTWGSLTMDSNAAGYFSADIPPSCMGSCPPVHSPAWDAATLTVYLDSMLVVVSATLTTTEVIGNVVSSYSLSPSPLPRALAPEAPRPGAVWLFGSGRSAW